MMEKPDVDLIEGLSPSISIDQKLHPKIHDRLLEQLRKFMTILEFYLQELGNHILPRQEKKSNP